MAKLSGKGLADFAISKLGTPYVYGAKLQDGPLTRNKVDFLASSYPGTVNAAYVKKIYDKKLIGKVCVDCSGLISGYTNKIIGSSQLCSTAKVKMSFKEYPNFAIGTVLWRQGHVGVFIGLGDDGQYHCIEAKGIDYGTINSIVNEKSKWTYGLTFDYMDYEYETKIDGVKRGENPYRVPTIDIKKGSKGEYAKWVQFELREAGFNLPFTYNGKQYKPVDIDGNIGDISVAAIKAFQTSCKIAADGIVGRDTKEELIRDVRKTSVSGNGVIKR